MQSCRELKKYISEGRSIVKEIESETFEDNPPLFREYMSATPDFKMLMDNQFKNVKTHARLLSKAMWYEWRMKLQDGLKEGLVKIRGEMEEDDESLKRQQELLDSVLPGVLARYEKLAKEHADLETYVEELAECDPEELKSARDELVSVESDIEAKKREIAELRGRLEETESEIEQVSSRKQECLEEIKEAEKIREECRGWSTTEINLHKGTLHFHSLLAPRQLQAKNTANHSLHSPGRSSRERTRLVGDGRVGNPSLTSLQARNRARLRCIVLQARPAKLADRCVVHRDQPRWRRTSRDARARILPAAHSRLCPRAPTEPHQDQRHARHGPCGLGRRGAGRQGRAGRQRYVPYQGHQDIGLVDCGCFEPNDGAAEDTGRSHAQCQGRRWREWGAGFGGARGEGLLRGEL